MKPRYRRGHAAHETGRADSDGRREPGGRTRRDPTGLTDSGSREVRSPRLSGDRPTFEARLARQRIALTIARRTNIRAIGRSALIIAMVALPVAGLAGVALVGDSMTPTTSETITTELGDTQARVRIVTSSNSAVVQSPTIQDSWSSGPSDSPSQVKKLKEPANLFPAGTRILPLYRTTVTATTATGIAYIQAIEGPSWDTSLAGHFDVIDGRAPLTNQEIMVTASTLPRLGAELGDTVNLEAPAPESVTIVGILDNQTQSDSTQMIFGREGALSGKSAAERLQQTDFYLPDTPLNWSEVQALNKEGATVLSRAVLSNPPPPDTLAFQQPNSSSFLMLLLVGAIAAGFGAFEVILLAGAAFTVTARQQQRTLATIASVGATRSTLFRVLSSSGIVLGAIGGVVGIAFGIAGGAVFMALTGEGNATRYFGFHIPWSIMLAITAFAVVIGWLSALMPARNASRFDIVSALRGARRPPVPSIRRPVAGLILFILGVVLGLGGGVLFAVLLEAGRGVPYGHPLLWVPIALLIAGPILAQLGLVLCGPLLLRGVARLMRHGGIGVRLASQDAARNPGRSVPALAATMTTIFVAVFAMSMMASADQNRHEHYLYSAALGTVRVGITYQKWTDSGPSPLLYYPNPAAVADAVRRSVDVDAIRTLASVSEPVELGGDGGQNSTALATADPAKTYPMPVIPPKNLCPSLSGSSEYTKSIKEPTATELRALDRDWRCGNTYPWSSFGIDHIWVGDANDLAMILGHSASPAAQRTLDTGGAVSFYPSYVDDGRLSIAWWGANQLVDGLVMNPMAHPARTVTLDAVIERPEHPLNFGLFVNEKTADAIGLDYKESMVMASTKTMPTDAQSDALTQAIMNLPENRHGEQGGMIYAQIERGPQPFAEPWVWGLLGLSGLIAIAAAAVAIGLARSDGRQDDATLSSLGAGHRVRQNFAFGQALVITGAGAVLGTGMGLVPALALSANADTPFAPPWLQIALMALALPLAIAVGNWLFTRRSRIPARRTTIA
jgi:hypothetical protein